MKLLLKEKLRNTSVNYPHFIVEEYVCAQSLSCVRLFVTLWSVAHRTEAHISKVMLELEHGSFPDS